MSGASIEQTLDLWSAELEAVKAQLQPLFGHASVAASAVAFLDGLLGPERRKTGWMRAEAAGDPGPWRQQAVLGRSRWDTDALRNLVRDYALEALAAPDAVLVVDETGFLKQGTSSCGVQRQYTGSAGKITNCQIGVFAAYVSERGHAFIDRRLYLPRSWTDQPDRLRAAHVPEDVRFATKPAIAVAMIERALETGVAFAWVAADSIYGVAMCSGSPARTRSAPGARRRWPARRKRSPRPCRHRPGCVSRPATAPRVRGGTTGPTWSWPTWRRRRSAAPSPALGPAAC
jgi:SRSO17 transposase